MQNKSSFLFFAVICILMGVLLVYAYRKDKNRNPYLILSALLFFLIPTLLTAGVLLESEKLISSAILFPMGAFLIATAVVLMIRYRKCSHPVSAKYVSRTQRSRGSRRAFYSPVFSFRYEGEDITVDSFISYSRRKFKTLFEEHGTYTVFIDPEKPRHCVDKRSFPTGMLVVLILGIVFLLFGAAVVI